MTVPFGCRHRETAKASRASCRLFVRSPGQSTIARGIQENYVAGEVVIPLGVAVSEERLPVLLSQATQVLSLFSTAVVTFTGLFQVMPSLERLISIAVCEPEACRGSEANHPHTVCSIEGYSRIADAQKLASTQILGESGSEPLCQVLPPSSEVAKADIRCAAASGCSVPAETP